MTRQSRPTTHTGPLQPPVATPAGTFTYRDGVWYFVPAPVARK